MEKVFKKIALSAVVLSSCCLSAIDNTTFTKAERVNRVELNPFAPFLGGVSASYSRKTDLNTAFGVKGGVTQVKSQAKDLQGGEFGVLATRDLTDALSCPYFKGEVSYAELSSSDADLRYANLRGAIGYSYTYQNTGLGISGEAGFGYKNGRLSGSDLKVDLPFSRTAEIKTGSFALFHPDVAANITYVF